ncbi:hypothetical protein CLV62_12223 [Dysgonomonas alginatilytica]|uniref:Uncharacterized protein n=1 Tax=Dysgonomonas alginatilytica TaxID=1605892 RepID=A0A2V3PMH2_9BACT|nr:hypothetical protein [Dysgonomonas alginatilytica]PXV62070.1 hypothetical protein CLV62_12223 [Dysgonomonas alginatilytica]
MQTEKTNIFNRKVSVFSKATDTTPIATTTILQAVTSQKIIGKVEEYRNTGDKALNYQYLALSRPEHSANEKMKL